MAFEIPEHFALQFTTNVELLLQQQTPHLFGHVSMASYSGAKSAQVVKQFGEVEFVQRTVRHEDTTFSDIQHKQRWVYPLDYTLALPIDKEDELRMLNSPLSPYAEAMRAAYARKWDDIVIASFFGSAQTGENGSTSTPFDTSNQVVAVTAGATGATGLNVEKLIQAREKLVMAEINLATEMPRIAVSQKQISDMLRQTEVTNKDYAALSRLESGEVNSFLGFQFVRTERLPTDGDGYRRNPVWVPSGIHAATWNGLETRIGERPDKEYLTQVFMRFSMGATRTQEKKVVEIKSAES